MSKTSIVALVGRAAIVQESADMLELRTVPQPDPGFEDYVLRFSPTKGLLKVVALGVDIKSAGDGSAAKKRFGQTALVLEGSYGKPSGQFDFLKQGGFWDKPNEFMMALMQEERRFNTFWTFKPGVRADHITQVDLILKANTWEAGYLTLVTEFEGWEEYVDSLGTKAGLGL